MVDLAETSRPDAAADDRRWLVSGPFDLTIVLAPLAVAVLSLLTLGEQTKEMPLWAFLLLIVAFDVAHVWATIYVTYLDPAALRRRWVLFFLPIPIAFVVSYRVYLHSPSLFWTLLAYVAIYHFIKQQYGFIALYKARAQERSRFDFYLDKWTLWAGALGPVLLWHAGPSKEFNWFNAGESFIARVDPALRPEILAAMIALGALYVGRQLQRALTGQGFNAGKNLWMGASWISWIVGIGLSDNLIVSAAFINLLHGIPFLALVWHRSHHRFAADDGGPSRVGRAMAWLSRRKNWIFFYAVVVLLALVEETLWDGMVWRRFAPDLLGVSRDALSRHALAFWVALLSIPQIVHYYLDAWIWRLDGSNPELRRILRL